MEPMLFPVELSPTIGQDLTFGTVLLSLLAAFVLGQAVAWVYIWTHSGLSYSRSFTQALVLDPQSPLPFQIGLSSGRQCVIGSP